MADDAEILSAPHGALDDAALFKAEALTLRDDLESVRMRLGAVRIRLDALVSRAGNFDIQVTAARGRAERAERELAEARASLARARRDIDRLQAERMGMVHAPALFPAIGQDEQDP
jgi:chromosome segregation ATPase